MTKREHFVTRAHFGKTCVKIKFKIMSFELANFNSINLDDILKLLEDNGPEKTEVKASSFENLAAVSPLDELMQEFRNIGSDSPYEPDDDDTFWEFKLPSPTPSPGSSQGQYLRQKSWPGAEKAMSYHQASASTVGQRRGPKPADWVNDAALEWNKNGDTGLLPKLRASDLVSQEQFKVLQTLPDAVLFALLDDLRRQKGMDDRRMRRKNVEECRFCKNNGERESYYRSHSLKAEDGRVECPVLRAFVCRRCGASGDAAHTIKYCPLSTQRERQMSAAMMRSIRMSSGRKRIAYSPPSVGDYQNDNINFGASVTPSMFGDENYTYKPLTEQPLDPVWADLARKLTL